HGHSHPKLTKKLNDKIPKTVDEMFKRVRAFIKGEVAAGSAEMGSQHQRLLSVKKQIEEAMASGKLAHLVKDIRQNNQRNGNQGRNNVKVINMIREGGNSKRTFKEERILVDGGSSLEIMYEHCFRDLNVNIRLRLRRCRAPMIARKGARFVEGGTVASTRRANVPVKRTSNTKNKEQLWIERGSLVHTGVPPHRVVFLGRDFPLLNARRKNPSAAAASCIDFLPEPVVPIKPDYLGDEAKEFIEDLLQKRYPIYWKKKKGLSLR
ncbi:hypothetical protein Tco_0935007, partial [Tanacetum coccineum]